MERAPTLSAADGTPLACRSWPVAEPRATVLLAHGLGEHGGRYDELVRALGDRAIQVHALDHRGHGRSGGQRGHADRFDDLVRDFEAFRAAVWPATGPVFVLGHSMGALVVLRHLQEHPDVRWEGAILSSPLLGIALRPPRWKTALSGVLSRLLPRLSFHNEISPDALSADPGYAAAWRADALLHQRVTPRMYTEIGRAMQRARAAPPLPMPVLVLAPGADRVVDPRAVAAWAAAQGGAATLAAYPGFRHEALNERERHRVLADVLAWIDARIG